MAIGLCLCLWAQAVFASPTDYARGNQGAEFSPRTAVVADENRRADTSVRAVVPMQAVSETVQTPIPSVPITNPIGITETITLTDLSASAAQTDPEAPADEDTDAEEPGSQDTDAEGTDTATEQEEPEEPEAPPADETPAVEEAAEAEADEPDAPLDEGQLDALYSDALEGTIIANRTPANVTFFVEGELYRLAPLRSFGLELPRENSVLNLFNCDADTPQTEEGCFWDPYLIRADGFYEIFNDAPETEDVRLVLEEAGAPPTDQVWVQNRTGQREVLVYNGETYELAPSAVVEFDVGDSPVVTFYRRSCLSLDGQTVCEWAPQTVEPGFYYALDEIATPGGPPDSQVIQVDIEPVLGEGGEAPPVSQGTAGDEGAESADDTSTAAEAPTGSQIVCQLQVPVLNVRSGPGLEYLVISQVTANGQEPTTVVAQGRDATTQWLAVADSVVEGGWITASDQFVQCNGDIGGLPLAEVTDGRLEPTPEAPVAEEAPADDASAETEGDSTDEEGAEGEEAAGDEGDAPEVEVPSGQALLIVNNAFEQEVRFTISPDEYDLQPGETIYVVVNPGRVQFSVSSPWRGGISGNAEFLIEPDQSEILWLYFIPNPSDSDEWELRYQ